MLKLKFLVVILFSIAFFSSCASKNIQTNSMTEAESAYYTKKIGTISDLTDANFEKKKLFITEEKEEYYITSNVINLSNDKINNSRIEIYGLLIKSNTDDRDLIEIEQIKILDNN